MIDLELAHDLNDKALQMWHSNNWFDGQVIFHMELFSNWYGDTDPLEIVKSLSPGFDANKPHLLIDQDNIAHSLDDQEFIEHMFKMQRSILIERIRTI